MGIALLARLFGLGPLMTRPRLSQMAMSRTFSKGSVRTPQARPYQR